MRLTAPGTLKSLTLNTPSVRALVDKMTPWRRPVAAQVEYVDYRDRISVGAWLLVFGIGLSLLVELPTITLNLRAFRTPLNIELGQAIFAATLLAQCWLQPLPRASFHSIPTSAAQGGREPGSSGLCPWRWQLSRPLVLLQADTRPLQVVGLAVAGALLTAALFFLYGTVEPGRSRLSARAANPRRTDLRIRRSLLFVFVYQTGARSLLSGSLVAFTALLLAVELLRTTTERVGLTLGYGVTIGLVLGEVTWALNYWKLLPDLTGGLLLLLIFYLLTGIAQQGLQGRLTRRVWAEFAFFALVALILIALVGPGFRQIVQF